MCKRYSNREKDRSLIDRHARNEKEGLAIWQLPNGHLMKTLPVSAPYQKVQQGRSGDSTTVRTLLRFRGLRIVLHYTLTTRHTGSKQHGHEERDDSWPIHDMRSRICTSSVSAVAEWTGVSKVTGCGAQPRRYSDTLATQNPCFCGQPALRPWLRQRILPLLWRCRRPVCS
jgi:hypothetical protein